MKRRHFGAMLPYALALILAAPVAAQPDSATVEQLCGSLEWPRAVPDVTGRLVSQTVQSGALACWTNVRGIAPDGHDPLRDGRDGTDYRVISISPQPGSLAGRADAVTVQLAVDEPPTPVAFHPCDWVTAADAGAALGGNVHMRPIGDTTGSVDISCSYSTGTGGAGLQSELRLSQSFPATAAASFAAATTGKNGTAVSDVGQQAQCVFEPDTTPPSTTLVVLLDDDRLYTATGWYGPGCADLKNLAQIAIGRIDAR